MKIEPNTYPARAGVTISFGLILNSIAYGFLSSALALSLCACSGNSLSSVQRDAAPGVPAEFGSPEKLPGQESNPQDILVGQEQILQAQALRARKVEVTFSARVRKLLPDDTKGLPHQQFLLQLDNGSTVKVAHDTKYAPAVPISEGDMLTIKGEYIWNNRGGVVHWTHRSDTPRHEGGYIDYKGQRYQ